MYTADDVDGDNLYDHETIFDEAEADRLAWVEAHTCEECGYLDCRCAIDDSPAAVEKRAQDAFRAQIADKKTWRNA